MTDIKSKRITLVRHPDYRIDLEYNKEFAIIHLPFVSKFTRDTYLDIKFAAEDAAEFLKDQGYPWAFVGVDPTNKLILKLADRFGFKYLGTEDNISVLGMEL